MIIRIIGFALLSALTAFLLSELGFRGKRVYSVLAFILLLLYFSESFSGVIKDFLPIGTDENADIMKTALKIVGVGYAFSFASDVCDELSEGGISKILSLICRVEIIIIIMPYIKKIINYAKDIMSQI